MRVSIITPVCDAHKKYLPRLRKIIMAQDYPILDHIIVEGGETIGAKRNAANESAQGDIIVHFDADDLYADNYVSKCVNLLQDCDIVGNHECYYYDVLANQYYLYRWKGDQRYVIESGMAYWKKAWMQKPFYDQMVGEGAKFQSGRNIEYLRDKELFLATLSDSNVSSRRVSGGFARCLGYESELVKYL